MKEIKTQIQINATPETIWKTLVDLPNWPQWNPIVNQMEGDLTVGSKLSIIMSDENGKDSQKYNATITSLEENKCFRFLGKMMASFLFSADRIIELEESQEGTLFIQREIYTGFLVSLFWSKLKTHATSMLNSMNEALKKEIER